MFLELRIIFIKLTFNQSIICKKILVVNLYHKLDWLIILDTGNTLNLFESELVSI